jgi:hypothetical protein
MILLPASSIKPPSVLKIIRKKEVIKNTSCWRPGEEEYYSSYLNDQRFIYSFLNLSAAKNCYSFLKKYKEVNKVYPDLHGTILKKKEEDFFIYIDDEPLITLKKRCLLNNIGLVGISSFDYTYNNYLIGKKNVFNLNFSAVDLLENESLKLPDQIENLNYLLDI